jgi:hypothetical protein
MNIAVRDVLGDHFVMWRALHGDGPVGEWLCQCGLTFGFSDSAIDHVAREVTAVLAAS